MRTSADERQAGLARPGPHDARPEGAGSGPGRPLLCVKAVDAGYGKIGILHGIDLEVDKGEIVAILDRTAPAKGTLMRAVSGLLPLTAGTISFDGQDISRTTPRDAARAGLVHVIEGHRVFAQQSVSDNLLLAGFDVPRAERRARIDEALAFFPEIAAKRNDRAGALSGGQQQMLVVAQGLVKRPRLLILDEPSAGLSPVLVDRVLTVARQLRERGTSVVLVEQLVEKALALADRVYALAQGRIVLHAATSEPGLPERLERAYLGEHGRVAA